MWLFIVSSLLYKGFCARKETPASLFSTTVPSSGESSPAIVLSKVDFPVPLRPIRAALSPSFKPNVTPVNKGFSRPIFARLFTDKRFMPKILAVKK